MKNVKKAVALLLALALCLSVLAACGGNSDQPVTDPQASQPQPVESQPASNEPAVSEELSPDPEPSGESAEKEETRIVAEDYVFEGPGIIDPFDEYPDSYKQEAAQQGRVEKITYSNGVEEKYFHIYLPYGYDTSDRSYNVLYLMHGGNGRPEVYLQPSHASNHQKVIDNMIQNGEVEPFIVVAVTWNSAVSGANINGYDGSMSLTEHFAAEEFVQYVIPLVDGNYRTNATREGRAFGGFSMGAVTTWYTFLHALDYVKYFLPFSGDCWALGQTAGATLPTETVAVLEQAVVDGGYTTDDFMIFAATGTQDIAIPNMAPQIYAMQDSKIFLFGENTYFGAYPEGTHMETFTRIYLYNALPLLWQDN